MSVLDENMNLLRDLVGDDKRIYGTFYYDETNIFHKLRITDNGTNNDLINQSFFGLGGLYIEFQKEVNVDDLIKELKPQKTMKEFKYKYFSRDNTSIEDALNSDRFLILLEWIDKNEISIHFTLMDYLYYGISDIIDSLPDVTKVAMYNRELKSVLYDIVRQNYTIFLELFYEFNYPNIEVDRIREFVSKFYDLYLDLNEYDNYDINDFPKELLRQMVKSAKSTNELVFIQNNKPLELFSEYSGLYIDRPIRFPNSNHIFDEVKEVTDSLRSWDHDFQTKLNSKFVDSTADIYVQFSDAIIGLISRVSNLILNKNQFELLLYVNQLNERQERTLRLLYKWINKGVKSSVYFNQIIAPNMFLRKQQIFINLLEKKATPSENE